MLLFLVLFFFQAEDGIRDGHVTGVQTCALPILQVKELFERSAKAGYLDLQALIMFLVFEKDVLAMEDSAEKLKVYYQDKHSERMNEELNAYKSKMNMKYDTALYGFNHGGG